MPRPTRESWVDWWNERQGYSQHGNGGANECSVQLLRHGLQLHLALNGHTPYCSRTFQTQDELLAWAEEERVGTLAEGWS